MEKLKQWLLTNVSFSTICGVLMIGLNQSLQDLMGFSNSLILPIVGANLFVFAIFIFWITTKLKNRRQLVSIIVGMDFIWVLGSVLLLVLQPFSLTNMGNIIIGIIAILVGILAIQQYRYNAKILPVQ